MKAGHDAAGEKAGVGSLRTGGSQVSLKC